MIHGIKVTFLMQEVSSRNIIRHRFHVNNGIGESGIGYNMIICRNVMVMLGLLAIFKSKVLQWNGATVPMK